MIKITLKSLLTWESALLEAVPHRLEEESSTILISPKST